MYLCINWWDFTLLYIIEYGEKYVLEIPELDLKNFIHFIVMYLIFLGQSQELGLVQVVKGEEIMRGQEAPESNSLEPVSPKMCGDIHRTMF